MTVLRTALTVFGYSALFFTITHFLAIGVWSLLSIKLLGRSRPSSRQLAHDQTAKLVDIPGVSIILPAYNEEAVIAHSVGNSLSQDYPKLEVIVVNDGSKDNTMQVMLDTYDMVLVDDNPTQGAIATEALHGIYRSQSDPRLWFIDKAPSGAKADNSNVGINVSNYPWIVVMDADEFMETSCITRCMVEVMTEPDNVMAVGTTLLPANDIVIDGPRIVDRQASTNYWVGCQLIEYLTAFIISRPGMAHIGAMPIVSGGFGLFRKEAVLKLGGYVHGHMGEDMDLCIRIHRHHIENEIPYRVVQAPEAIVWTEFPSTRPVLRKQRIRWHRGLKQIIEGNKDVIGRGSYGTFGRYGMSTLYFFEWWGPIIEGAGWFVMLGLMLLGWLDPLNALSMILATQLIGQVSTFVSVAIGIQTFGFYSRPKDLAYMFFWALCANWGFRQQSLFWRVRSLFPGANGWGEMTRAGFKTVATT